MRLLVTTAMLWMASRDVVRTERFAPELAVAVVANALFLDTFLALERISAAVRIPVPHPPRIVIDDLGSPLRPSSVVILLLSRQLQHSQVQPLLHEHGHSHQNFHRPHPDCDFHQPSTDQHVRR